MGKVLITTALLALISGAVAQQPLSPPEQVRQNLEAIQELLADLDQLSQRIATLGPQQGSQELSEQLASQLTELRRQMNDLLIAAQVQGAVLGTQAEALTRLGAVSAQLQLAQVILLAGGGALGLLVLLLAGVAFSRAGALRRELELRLRQVAIDAAEHTRTQLRSELAAALARSVQRAEAAQAPPQPEVPAAPPEPPPPDPEVLSAQGQRLLAEGKADEAAPLLRQALALAPHPDTLRALARTEALLGRYDEAARILDELLEQDSGDRAALLAKAEALLAAGRLEAALEAANAAIILEKTDTRAIVLRGRALVELGRLEEARKAAEHVLDSKPADPGALALQGRVYAKEGKLQQALKSAERALEYQPDHPAALYLKASIFARTGYATQALDLLGKAARADQAVKALASRDPDL